MSTTAPISTSGTEAFQTKKKDYLFRTIVSNNSVSTVVILDMEGFASFSVEALATTSGPTFNIQGCDDLTSWHDLLVQDSSGALVNGGLLTPSNTNVSNWVQNKTTRFLRVLKGTASGICGVNIALLGTPIDSSALSRQRGTIPFPPLLAGITTAGDTVLLTAPSPRFRNIITSMTINNAGLVDVKVSITSNSVLKWVSSIKAGTIVPVITIPAQDIQGEPGATMVMTVDVASTLFVNAKLDRISA